MHPAGVGGVLGRFAVQGPFDILDDPRTLAGVIECYIAAIPFYGRTVASDLLYSGALFGLHAWLSRMVARSERVSAMQTA